MTYHFSKTVDLPFDAAVAATIEALKHHGFGVLTQIDVKDTLNKKLGVEFQPYLILGACNPKLAYEALTVEDKIGTMLPCNVVVQQRERGKVEISAVDPVASMTAIENPKLGAVAGQVRELLKQVVAEIA
ncbi:DUF302 domain-containing protein [Bradyrhizobium betae]|uniref:DUF302 domain-containing protein n=1 Tax=Bradyrhizobium betae TaxID=244734 RepID=A0A5P6PBQ1_9BRAD|nr:DUF302 domain-containing protein [Bradyrhizobium betae]MCS3730012.1 uncharacterized protein (DUF302 family) [Bradyrhizobium betae]QFI75799.1 DUF302 domain-containing protein [Bradyrhizobium betae]